MAAGIIAGSGAESLFGIKSWHEVMTVYGPAYLAEISIGNKKAIVQRRHGPELNIPPHLVNFRANLSALRQADVKYVLSTAAVGSLRLDLAPGSIAIVGDFIDFTRSGTNTIYDKTGSPIEHTDFTHPFSKTITDAVESAANMLQVKLSKRVTYICVDGPRYETAAEVRMFGNWGADVVGMTLAREAVPAVEMGFQYASLALVTNYATGLDAQKTSHEEVLECVSDKRAIIRDLIEKTVELLP